MENQNAKRFKKRVFILAVFVCCAAILAAGTLAYFTAEETAFNVITTGRLDMTLHEETTGGQPFPKDGISGVMPGEMVDKVVYIENTGDCDFYARIALSQSAVSAEGQALDTGCVSLDIDTANWTEKDGFFYYHRALKPGEKTEPLFKTVTFDKAMDNSYMEARFRIDVTAQTVQSKNNGDSALTAVGWPGK